MVNSSTVWVVELLLGGGGYMPNIRASADYQKEKTELLW